VPTLVPPGEIIPGGDNLPRIPPEAIAGGLGLLAVAVYGVLYWRSAANAERYRDGFVITRCPVCREGKLILDEHSDRVLGIPRVRRTVRCTVCHSTLREVRPRKWRYTIDKSENYALYERYNGRVFDEDFLRMLPNQPYIRRTPEPRPPLEPPTFEEDRE
jgi:hypothetical protein